MIGDPVSITYNSVAKNLVRVNQDNFGADYYLDDGLIKFGLTVRHTIPSPGGFPESHLARLNCEHYDSSNALLRIASSWCVIRTDQGIQDATSSSRAALALQTFLTSGNITKLLQRES